MMPSEPELPTFDRLCNFLAVSKTGDRRATVHGLTALAFFLQESGTHASPQAAADFIREQFGINLPTSWLQEALSQLEKDDAVRRGPGGFVMQPQARIRMSTATEQVRALEESAKREWGQLVANKAPSLPLDVAWKYLQEYLASAFHRHGVQVVSWLNPGSSDADVHPLAANHLSNVVSAAAEEHQQSLRVAIELFLSSHPSAPSIPAYISQLADGAFNFYLLETPPDVSKKLRGYLKDATVFLDTNFLFGLLALHNNTQVDVSRELIDTIREQKLPFRLRYHEATQGEMRATIAHYASVLRSRRWTSTLSAAAARVPTLSGIELKFHERNAAGRIDVDEFLRPYEHFDELLAERDIKIYRPASQREQAQIDIFSDYQEYLKSGGRRDKTYATVMHDAKVLEEVRHIRGTQDSSLSMGALLLSCDYHLYRFDMRHARNSRQRGCVLLPNVFWQIIRPFVSASASHDKAFADSFGLPAFRAIGSGGNRACSRMLQILASYKDVPEDTAYKLLSNDMLIDKLSDTSDDSFEEQVEHAFIAENQALLEENASLEAKVEVSAQEIAKQDVDYQRREAQLKKDLDSVKKDLNSARAAAERAEAQARKAESLARQAEQREESARSARAHRARALREAVASVLLYGCSIALVIAVWWASLSGAWPWMAKHKHQFAINLVATIMVVTLAAGLRHPSSRKLFWGVAGTMFVAMIPMLGDAS